MKKRRLYNIDKNVKKKKDYSAHLTLAIVFIAGVLTELIFSKAISKNDDSSLNIVRQSAYASSTYQLIDPLLTCSISDKDEADKFSSLKSQIQNFINDKKNKSLVSRVSVYFDTRDGNWMTIDPQEKYNPASLMKVPTEIAYLKAAETQPNILTQQKIYDGSYNYNNGEYFKPKRSLVPGTTYTIDDLLYNMVNYSDNNAYYILINSIDNKILYQTYTDLGMNLQTNSNEQDFMTVSQYANFFRVLYNASYLDRDMSEKALQYMLNSGLPQGIVGSVPQSIAVANKFGERNYGSDPNDPTSQKELHDCGIIYYPRHPYLLCIMTAGTNFNDLAGVISGISGLAYYYVSGQ
jgi:beta-lactamase class A